MAGPEPSEAASRFLSIDEGSTRQTWEALAYHKISGTDRSGTGYLCVKDSIKEIRSTRVVSRKYPSVTS